MRNTTRTFAAVFATSILVSSAGAPAHANTGGIVASPEAAATSPDQTVERVAHALAAGDLVVAWDALPASYQRDITELTHEFAANVDAELWNKGFGVVRSTGAMLQSKKDLILAMPKFQETDELDLDRMSQEWDLVVAPFMTIASSELAEIESFKQIDVRQFLATTGSQFAKDLMRVSEFKGEGGNDFAKLAFVSASVVSQDGDTAEVRMEAPGEEPHTETFVLVEGKWVPQDMAAEWSSEMADAKAKIATMSPENFGQLKPQLMGILTGVEGTIAQLNQAETPAQFEQGLQMGMFQVFGGMMSIAQAMETE